MQLSSVAREGLAIGAGALLGITAAGGVFTAIKADDEGTKRIGGIVAGAATLTAAGIGAFLLRSPATRIDAAYGALGFFGLPSMLMTGVIQNRRDS